MEAEHRRIEVRVDVSRAAGLDGVETAATIHLPAETPRALVFAFPGRGYARAYYDLGLAGGYSQAAHHTARGLAVIACDHLGVGESSLPDLTRLTMEQLAAANHATVESILDRLRAGSLSEGLDPIRPRLVVGIGQSMGGCLLTVQQARNRTFDAVAILGWSGHQTVLPVPPGALPLQVPGVGRGADPSTYPPRTNTAADLRYAYHWEDVPESIAVPDTEWAVGNGSGTMPAWRSSTGPEVSRTMLSPGVVAEEAAAIAAPIFLGVAERDVCPNPRGEPSAYRSARDITLFIQPARRTCTTSQGLDRSCGTASRPGSKLLSRVELLHRRLSRIGPPCIEGPPRADSLAGCISVAEVGWRQGTDLDYLRELVGYWRDGFDWRRQEARLNRFHHHRATVAGQHLHFIHEPGRGPNPLPLLLLNGWPSSVFEHLPLIPLLTDPVDPAEAFTVVAPSLPGFTLSYVPGAPPPTVALAAAALAELMTGVLGYSAVRRRRGRCRRHPDVPARVCSPGSHRRPVLHVPVRRPRPGERRRAGPWRRALRPRARGMAARRIGLRRHAGHEAWHPRIWAA